MSNSNGSCGAFAMLLLFFLGLILWAALSPDVNEATVQQIPGQQRIDFAQMFEYVGL